VFSIRYTIIKSKNFSFLIRLLIYENFFVIPNLF